MRWPPPAPRRCGRLLALHDGARVANALCLGLTLWLLALAGRELYGGAFRWLPVLVFIGCIGLWDRAHALAPEIGLLPAYALALYALAMAPRRALISGLLLGASAGIAFLVRGTPWAAMIALTALLLVAFPPWRTRRYAGTLALAVLVAAPLLIAWPLAMYLRDPRDFRAVVGWAKHRALLRLRRRLAAGRAVLLSAESAVVRLARVAAGAVDAVAASARLQRRPRAARYRACRPR